MKFLLVLLLDEFQMCEDMMTLFPSMTHSSKGYATTVGAEFVAYFPPLSIENASGFLLYVCHWVSGWKLY